MKVFTRGLGAIQEAGKYTCASIEYTGMISFGFLRAGGRAVVWSVRRVATPVTRGLCLPFSRMRSMTRGLLGREKTYLDEKFQGVEDRLADIQCKLANLEKRGVAFPAITVPAQAPRKLDVGRQVLLRQIVEANKSLMNQE